MSRKPLVIFHANCTDGMGAAWVVNRHLGGECQLRPWRYDAPPPDLELVADRQVFIVDFSFRRPELLRMVDEAGARITLLDHHKTAAAELSDLPFCIFDMERSGAGLAWDVLIGGKRPWLVDFPKDGSREAIAAWNSITRDAREAVASYGLFYLQTSRRLAREIAEQAVLAKIDGHFVWVACAPVLFSEVAGQLAERLSDEGGHHEFGASCYPLPDGRWTYSLRSRGRFDVSALARKFGGGGHPQAAGFTVQHPVHTLWREAA